MKESKTFLKLAVPGVAALLALAIATATENPARGAGEVVRAPMDGPTPYSADHARAQRTAPDTEQPPTF